MTNPIYKKLPHIIALALLIFILLFVLTKFGYIRCYDIPGFCEIYYAVVGHPRVAIVYGDAGMGDPDLLRNVIIERTHIFPDHIPLENLISGGILDQYQLVIVEKARKMDTAAMNAFKDYVTGGKGILVWVGDAGIELGDKDNICEEITFQFLPAYNYTDNLTGEVKEFCQTEWIVRIPDDPPELAAGLCGRTFGEVVEKFVTHNDSIWLSTTTHGLHLCTAESNSYRVSGTGYSLIRSCIDYIEKTHDEVTEDLVDENCIFQVRGPYYLGYNYWDRGPTATEAGTVAPAIDFSSQVLGIDLIGPANLEGETTYLNLYATKPDHPLVQGYTTETQWFGEDETVIISIQRFPWRTEAVMNIKLAGVSRPAIVISSPVGPLTGRGLIVYYAFPPEVGAETGRGINLINNLIHFTLGL